MDVAESSVIIGALVGVLTIVGAIVKLADLKWQTKDTAAICYANNERAHAEMQQAIAVLAKTCEGVVENGDKIESIRKEMSGCIESLRKDLSERIEAIDAESESRARRIHERLDAEKAT